jgi:hypothetical protein
MTTSIIPICINAVIYQCNCMAKVSQVAEWMLKKEKKNISKKAKVFRKRKICMR